MAPNRRVQYLAAFAVSLTTLTTSFSNFWTTPVVPMLYNNETSITNISKTEISWVVAATAPGMLIGTLVASRISDRFGRRTTLLESAAPFVIGTIFVLCATKAWMLYIARFLWGCGCGMVNTVLTVYLTEIADKDIRGTLTACTRFMFSFGILLILTVGSFVTYQTVSSLMIVFPITYFVACWKIPESPYYLLKVGKVDAARKELMRLSGTKDEKIIEEKFSLMRSDVRKEMLRSSSIKELFTGKQYRKAIITVTGLRVTQLMSGSIPIQLYLGRIIQESHSGIKLSTAFITFGLVLFAVGLLSPMFVDKVGRRPLLIYTFLGASLMISIVGAYFFLQKKFGIDDESSNPFRFVVLIGIILRILISNLGFDVLIFIIPSEIFPLNVRSVAMTMLNIFNSIVTFLVVKGYQPMENYIGLYGVFWFYASMGVIGAVFTYFVVNETKGKSLREIQIDLQGNFYDEADETLKSKDVELEDISQNTTNKERVL